MLINIVVIALGAAVGANLRYGVSLWAAAHLGATFPYGTLLINVAGSFVIGLVMAVSTQFRPMSEPLRLLVVTGLLGGFTTFSSLSYEAYSLLAQGNWPLALAYCAGSVLLGLLGVALAFALVGIV